MFWIGFIVGMLVLIALSAAFFAWGMHISGTTVEDFNNLVDANKTALLNRESRIEVYHDDECLFEAVFEEN